MDILDNAHTCVRCQKIEFDGTGPHVEQRFQFSYNHVRAFAAECLLLRWCLLRARGRLEPTDRLVLSTCEDSENVVCLNVRWKNENDQDLFTDYFCDRTSLHIFASKGMSCSFTGSTSTDGYRGPIY
jgi:hypothetical protein